MNMTPSEAALWLGQQEDILILTHRRPDGDTVGCAVALCLALRRLGKTAYVLTNEDATALFDPYWGDTLAPVGFEPQTVVTVDVAAEGLFHRSAEIYKYHVDLAIDHHGSNEGFAQYNCVEGEKAACGEILCAIIKEWFPVDAEIALPLYLAVSTDTGGFLFSNTTPNTHRVAAELMETGIDYAAVNKRHFRTKSYTRLQIESRIIDTLVLHDDGAIALAAVSLADMAEFGATDEDLEDIAAFVGQLKGVRISATIRELKPGECKLSLRSGKELDASKVCALLGGGGHAGAAGCTVMGSVEEARTAILWAIRQIQNWN